VDPIQSSGQTFTTVVWTGSAFVALGNGVVATSEDGVTWTCTSVPMLFDTAATVGMVPALSLGAIDVRFGPAGGGTTVTLSGNNISPSAQVVFGGTSGTVTGASSTALTATTPVHATGTVDVVVVNPDGQSSTLAGAYTYIAAPMIAEIAPQSGPTAGGGSLTISGSGFQNPTVSVGGATATVTAWTDSSITATLPPHAEGTVSVVVTNGDHQSSTLPDSYTYGAPPTLTSVAPGSGFASGGKGVTLTGTDFAEGASVTFGGAAATSIVVASTTVITATTPAHDPGAVVVRNPDGKSATLAAGYTFFRSPSGCGTAGGPAESLLSLGLAVLLAGGRIGAGRRVRVGKTTCESGSDIGSSVHWTRPVR
jgi:hypothetical protein